MKRYSQKVTAKHGLDNYSFTDEFETKQKKLGGNKKMEAMIAELDDID